MVVNMTSNTTRNTTTGDFHVAQMESAESNTRPRPNTTTAAKRRPKPPKQKRGDGSTFYDERGKCVLEHRITVDGKTTVYRERGDSWPEVEEMRDARRAEVGRRSRLADDGTTTLAEAYADWLEYEAPTSLRSGGLVAPGTMRNHRETLRLLGEHPLGATPLTALRVRDVEAWFAELADSHGFSQIGEIRARLIRVLNRAVRLELVETNVVPATVLPAKASRRKKPKWIKDRDAFTRMREYLGRADATAYERANLMTLLTGARPGEVLGLKWDAVELDEKRLHIRSGLQVEENGRTRKVVDELKTASSRRTLAMPGDLVAVLRAERLRQATVRLRAAEWGEGSLVFTTDRGRPLNPSNVRRAMREACKTIGIAYVTPNQLRHTFASMALDLGFTMPAVAVAMGHEDTRMVAATYGHAMDDVVPTGAAFDRLSAVT